jgi:hypothetical protein
MTGEEREMTQSPRLPGGIARHAAGAARHGASAARRVAGPEGEATEAELNRMAELARRRDARTIAIGRGRSAPADATAAAFAGRWEAEGRIVLDIVTWPEEAASWLRQATRFAAADPDLWVMTGPAVGWAQMTRRLLWSTPWQPGRTIAFADLGTWHAVGLVGPHNLDGLTGATADGGTWAVRDGQLQAAAPLVGSLSRPARFPYPVTARAAHGARAVPGGDRGRLVGEEDAIPHVAAGGDRAQRGGAVEAAVDLQAAVTAPPALRGRLIGLAVRPQQGAYAAASRFRSVVLAAAPPT